MPTDPLNDGYKEDGQTGYPYWFIKVPTTWKPIPTSKYPKSWIDKFYPKDPPLSFTKNLKERFISEDETNCPNTKWWIGKVINSKTMQVVPESKWNQHLRINETTGDFIVDDFSDRFINTWNIHLVASNEFHNTGDQKIVELTVFEPFIPEKKVYPVLESYENTTVDSPPDPSPVKCLKENEVRNSRRDIDYRGCQTSTITGKKCQAWD